MKYSQSEKMEIIRMVEDSKLSVRKTLRQIDISRSTFYQWYKRYQKSGYCGLACRHQRRVQFWNAIPEWEKARVVEVAREYPAGYIACLYCDLSQRRVRASHTPGQ